MKRVIYIIIIVCCILPTYAQDIEVKKMELLAKDQTAAISPRKDINGNTCGLLKVALKEPGAEFEGNVMGKVEFTGKEYLVYLPNGTKRIGIKHADYLPITIVFSNYGVKSINSGNTYSLSVKANKKKTKLDNSKKGMVVFNVKPTNTLLLVDGQIADGTGGAYSLSLPYGTHYYTIKMNDFGINNQAVQIDKNAKNIDIDLTDLFAKVSVSCKTENSDIIINNEQKGVRRWSGMMIPGKYIIEARKDGCHSLYKTIVLKENDSINIDFSELKKITGSLRVENELDECELFLNGKKVGKTPYFKKDLPVGEYYLELRHKYYSPIKKTILINEDQEMVIKDKFYQPQMDKIIMHADMDDEKACYLLATLYLYGNDIANKEGWGVFVNEDTGKEYYIIDRELFLKEDIKVEVNFDKAACFAKKAIKLVNVLHDYDYWLRSKCYIPLDREFFIGYITGKGTNKDYKESFYWANEISHSYWRNYWKAWHYYNGLGVQKDVNKALALLNKNGVCTYGVNPITVDKRRFYTTCSIPLFYAIIKNYANFAEKDDSFIDWDNRYLEIIDNYR